MNVQAQDPDGRPIAYVMSRFPKLTETFILFEILAVERLGERVEIYPLLRHQESVSHPEALALLPRVHFQPSFLGRSSPVSSTSCATDRELISAPSGRVRRRLQSSQASVSCWATACDWSQGA